LRSYESPYSLKFLKESAYLPKTIEEFNKAKESLKLQKKFNEYLFIYLLYNMIFLKKTEGVLE